MRRLTSLPGIALTGYGVPRGGVRRPLDQTDRPEAEILRLAVVIRPMQATTP